jgi:2-dehydro-3-deoxyphosphogluconate aldolase / (4S)-4-hydroxy-2-oxoglutarate aldolase
MSIEMFLATLRRHRILAILRGVPPAYAEAMAQALYAGGIRLLEVSLSRTAALEGLRALAATRPPDMLVGAGTVVSRALAEQAKEAGATFFVTPHVVSEVAEYAGAFGIPVLCGAMTPTEIAAAREQGCGVVKLFPATALGADYLRSLRGPYPDLELLAVGGIGADNLAEYLAAGALGVGIGGALTSVDWKQPDWGRVTRLAADLTRIVAENARV